MVEKYSPDAYAEARHAEILGTSVCPVIYRTTEFHYYMELLEPVQPFPRLLREIERKLESKVWCREWYQVEKIWDVNLSDQLGINIPSFVVEGNSPYVATHGDPTASNAAWRDEELILLDPRPPRPGIPSLAAVDHGKILQSMAGWEAVAYGQPFVHYDEPKFVENGDELRRALFWCFVAARRIRYKELKRKTIRDDVVVWCHNLERTCRSAASF